MNTKHVPSLELCQEFDRLCKEKGIVVPETEYQWQIGGKLSGETTATLVPTNRPPTYGSADSAWRFIPAPLVSEQGEWLKFHSHKSIYGSKTGVAKNVWRWHFFADFDVPDLMADTEANARMMGLNYLITEGIITTL